MTCATQDYERLNKLTTEQLYRRFYNLRDQCNDFGADWYNEDVHGGNDLGDQLDRIRRIRYLMDMIADIITERNKHELPF